MPRGALLTLVETPTFARRRPKLLDDDEYRVAQIALARSPELGDLIPGGGGLRKVRWELDGRGRRGGARIIYYWAANQEMILLLFIHAKGEMGDLSKEQTNTLAKLVKEEFK